MHDLLSISNVSHGEISELIALAAKYKKKGIPDLWRKQNTIVASLFFEASTRTRLSFESATHRLGGRVIGFDTPDATSFAQKGESIEDTIRMIDAYADVIVMRHPETASVHTAAAVADIPVINAGNGTEEHPTQVLTDLFTMHEKHGSFEGLTVAIIGDLKYGRVPHSLAKACAIMGVQKQIWVHPAQLPMPTEVQEEVEALGATVQSTTDLRYAAQEADVIYMTRVQAERFDNIEEYEQLKDAFILTPEMMESAKATSSIMHALPRRYELPESVDALPQAVYFEQAANAVYMRAAILASLNQ